MTSGAELAELAAAIAARPWLEVVYDRYYHADPGLFRRIADETRADFRFLLPLQPGARVLEVGPDWGLATAALAREHTVTAVDPSADRLAFIRGRLAQQGLAAELVTAEAAALPFAAAQFDAVVLQAPLGPETLSEAHRVLVPGGWLYGAFENRAGFRAMLGAGGAGESLAAIAARLEAAGFLPPTVYLPYPDAQCPEAFLGAEAGGALAYYLTAVRETRPIQDPGEQVRRLELAAEAAGQGRAFAPAYGLVARKAPAC